MMNAAIKMDAEWRESGSGGWQWCVCVRGSARGGGISARLPTMPSRGGTAVLPRCAAEVASAALNQECAALRKKKEKIDQLTWRACGSK